MFGCSQSVAAHGIVFYRVTMAKDAGDEDDKQDGGEENLLARELTALVSSHHSSTGMPGGILACQCHHWEHIRHTDAPSRSHCFHLQHSVTYIVSEFCGINGGMEGCKCSNNFIISSD